MSKNIVPQAVGTIISIHPTRMVVSWDVFSDNPDIIHELSIGAQEKDVAGNIVQNQDVSIDPLTLPPGQLVALNQIIDHMLDEYFSAHGYVEQP